MSFFGVTSPARAGESGPSAADVEAAVRHAGALYRQGLHTEALTLLEPLRSALGARRADFPRVELSIARCLDGLGRPEKALAAYELAALWAHPSDDIAGQIEALRAELLTRAFGRLKVRCPPGEWRIRIRERDEVRDCPAEWLLPAGRHWTVEADHRGRSTGPVVERVWLTPGITQAHAVDEPAALDRVDGAEAGGDAEQSDHRAAGWWLGVRLGAGMASLVGRGRAVSEASGALTRRVAADGGIRFGDSGLALRLEGGVLDGRVDWASAHATDIGTASMHWYAVEGVLMLEGCYPFSALSLCAVGGGGVQRVVWAVEENARGRYALSEALQTHLDLRGGVEAQWGMGWLGAVVGLYGGYTDWPGILSFADGTAPLARIWLDLGIRY